MAVENLSVDLMSLVVKNWFTIPTSRRSIVEANVVKNGCLNKQTLKLEQLAWCLRKQLASINKSDTLLFPHLYFLCQTITKMMKTLLVKLGKCWEIWIRSFLDHSSSPLILDVLLSGRILPMHSCSQINNIFGFLKNNKAAVYTVTYS